MSINPYQSPVEQTSEPAVPDPLRLPAIGCLVSAVIGCAVAGWSLYLSMPYFDLAREYESEKALKEGWELARAAAWTFALCVVALFVAWSMATRRNKWIVLLSALAGIVLCFPAPLAAIILMRLRRREVWGSFARKQPSRIESVDD